MKKRIRLKAVKDFDSLPVSLCPGALHMYNCERSDNGAKFQIGRLVSFDGRVTMLYPAGNDFARKTALIIRREG